MLKTTEQMEEYNEGEYTIRKYQNGTTVKYRNGLIDCDDGPAITWKDCKAYYRKGMLHRVNGPAVIWTDGYEAYYINGVESKCH